MLPFGSAALGWPRRFRSLLRIRRRLRATILVMNYHGVHAHISNILTHANAVIFQETTEMMKVLPPLTL